MERIDARAGDRIVPLIPYDVFTAAETFLNAGRTPDEVLPLVGVSTDEWEALRAAYQWFHSHLGDFDKQRYIEPLTQDEVARAILGPRWTIPETGGQPLSLRVVEPIREATLRKPHVGAFQNAPWTAVYVATHPEASLRHYLHDGETVYFAGRPLETRAGEPLGADAATFECVGGRWLKDARRVYGQGEIRGGRARFYWYEIEGSDAATFEALNLRYAKDKNQAYYITGKTIRTRSPEAFEIVPERRLNYRDLVCEPLPEISHIAQDREKVYFYGAALRGAKPGRFLDLGHGYLTDGESVWFEETKGRLDGVDAASFTVPGPGEPHVAGSAGGHAVTDRVRPYERGAPQDPTKAFEAWREFFEFRSDLDGWWWHKARGASL